MGREILFHGKRVDNGEWVYGLLCQYHEGVSAKIALNDFGAFDIGMAYCVDPATVGQYTGLTGKNGVKIFEGDIFRCDEPEDPSGKYLPVFGVVKFGEYKGEKTGGRYPIQSCDFGFFVEWKDNEDDDYSRTYRKDLGYWVKYPHCEVCGNIHDNPELMGGGT